MSKLAHSNQETMDAIEMNAMKNDDIEHCQCEYCIGGNIHDSDCAVHSEPAYPNGPCDCSLQKRIVPQEMVDRFLSWPLPVGFSPDCGISFDGRGKDAMGYEKQWPIGTNLFSAEQARNMLEHVVAPTLRYERLLLSSAEKELAERSASHSASQPDTVAVPRDQLEHWAEYWNGSANEKAMSDALEHILGEVADLIRAAQDAK
jgi:hypothetical protein